MIIEIKGSNIVVSTEVYEFQTYSDDIKNKIPGRIGK